MNRTVFMLMIEPTPYILGFIREVRSAWKGSVEVAFVGRNLSQPWGECAVADEFFTAGYLSETRRLWTRLKSGRYVLVHLAGWSHPLVFTALLICALRGIPISVESDTPRRAESGGWRPWVKRMLYPWLFRLPRLFLPGGSRQAAYFSDYGVPDDRIRIARMTVDVEAILVYRASVTPERRNRNRQRLGLAKDQVAFLFVGRLESHKGIRDMLDAYRELREHAAAHCALLIAGDGSCRHEVDEAAARVPGIMATGRLSGVDLLDIYVAADVFVLPSLREPWGLVVNEAMASGLPVIVTDAVGCADDLVEPGVTGLIVPAGSPAALAEAMQHLAGDAGLRRAFSHTATERIRPWTLRNEAGRVVVAWREVLGI